METQEHDQEDRDLNDEILIVTSAFRGHRNGKICAVTTPTTQVILTNSLPSANATGASHSTEIDDNGEDDEEEYATCSVSDLVAAFEARAAEIAACDTTSICSESPCAPSTPLPHPPAPLNFPPLREPPNLEPAGGPREEEIPRAWNVPKPASFQYASKPPSRVYSTNHKRWSMSHSIGAQMSPALRYMQRSQRTSTLSRPASVSEDESNVIARRSAFIIPISDCRVKAAQSETLVEEATSRPQDQPISEKDWQNGLGFDVQSEQQNPLNDSVNARVKIRKCNTEQSPSGSNNECPAFGSADLQLNNSKLRERIIDVLERDEWNTTLPATIREQLECQPKKSHLRMQDMSDNDTLTKALNFERPKNSSSGETVGEDNELHQDRTVVEVQADKNSKELPESHDILKSTKWIPQDQSVRLKANWNATPSVETNRRLRDTPTSATTLIPIISSTQTPKISLLEEFRLLRQQNNWSSKPTVNMERPDTSYPMYSSFIESIV
uniref:Coronin n=1 Tax=Mesocestoides corti TaxID=53468 RepID=A0A5K3EWJ3_MESCO